jgi:rhamnosyltransferase
MAQPAASVIVRAKDEERTIERTLSLVRRQTVEVELIVVDSGSSDRTPEIARAYCDQVIEIPAEAFTFGHALNVGARRAAAPFHFALSAHCFPERPDWVERSLVHYERENVAATVGLRYFDDGRPIRGPYYQNADDARRNPYWGFSNHASSWRASVWKRFPFDEAIEAAEDKEWALRVLSAGWLIAIDPILWVEYAHVWRSGVLSLYRRQRRCARAIAAFAPLERYRLRDLLHEWWSGMPDDRHPPMLHRLDYRRAVGLAGKYVGQRSVQAGQPEPMRR